MAMIAVRGEFKQNFVKAAIRIAVIELLSTYENVCTQRQREETEREKKKQNKTKTEKKTGTIRMKGIDKMTEYNV